MCGIAGILSYEKKITRLDLRGMTNAIKHRGPDGEGHWINVKGNIGLGHRRLSIIDLSEDGKQPMQYSDGRYTITFNGEIYNYIELKKRLEEKGYRFKSQSDTEVLLALYADKKENCLQDLDGMFSFAIWDELKQELFCARDRFGEKPFFYTFYNNTFIFASEMKALWTFGIPKKPNRNRIFLYLAYGTLTNETDKTSTFYEEIKQLEASHHMTVNKSGVNIKKYWDIQVDDKIDISFQDATSMFYQLFKSSIRKRLRSDVPVGSSLSGGLDSSSIVSIINEIKRKNQTQKTFSARFKNFKKDEGHFIHEIIDKYKVSPHFVWITGDDFISNLDKVFYHQEEPFGSASIVAQWEVMKLAKENQITVLLDGQGADEVLAGYIGTHTRYLEYLYVYDKKLYLTEKTAYEKKFQIKFNKNISSKIRSQIPSLAKKWDNFKYNTIIKHQYLQHLSIGFINENKGIKPYFSDSVSLRENLKSLCLGRGLNELLRYADRNSMGNAREVRLPFLSHKLVEFLFRLPDEYKINNGWTKYILRNTMSESLPKKVCWRSDKIGFEPPQKKWMTNKIITEKVSSAIEKLHSEQIITKHDYSSDLEWRYLMVSKCYE